MSFFRVQTPEQIVVRSHFDALARGLRTDRPIVSITVVSVTRVPPGSNENV